MTILITLGVLFGLFLLYTFIVALIKTINDRKQPKFDAGLGFGGNLEIKHIKKTK